MSCQTDEIPTYQRESIEFQAISVTRPDGSSVTTGVLVAITTETATDRPDVDDWIAALELDGNIGVMVNGPTLGPGTFVVWAKAVSAPETVVQRVGLFRVA